MRKELTDITVILDRSGSMSARKEEAEMGLNRFISEQKKLPGEAVFTLVQFDTEYEFVHKAVPIKDVPEFHFVPRGYTALLDAVGKAIGETGERLAKREEQDRPGLVVFVILTDGLENASKEYSRDQVRTMIEHQREVYKWQFTYLGANQDAFAEAGGMGIPRNAAVNYAGVKTGEVFGLVSRKVGEMRESCSGGRPVPCTYTPEERKSLEEDQK